MVDSGSANQRVSFVEVVLFSTQEISSVSFRVVFAPRLFNFGLWCEVSNIGSKVASNLHNSKGLDVLRGVHSIGTKEACDALAFFASCSQ